MRKVLLISFLLGFPASLIWAHEEAGESKASIGPDKGVLKADEHEGFVLRPSAEKNFAIRKVQLKSGPQWTIPSASLVYSGLETQVFRQRGGYWKTIDVEIIRKTGSAFEIRSKELNSGDFLAVAGTGFLKIVEQSVFGPAAEAHDH